MIYLYSSSIFTYLHLNFKNWRVYICRDTSGPSQVTKINLFARIGYVFKLTLLTIFIKSIIMDVWRALMTCPGLECSSWASGNGPVQMFFQIPTRIMFVQEYIFCKVKWVEARKVNEVFWTKLYCKMRDFFVSFGWLYFYLDFSEKEFFKWTACIMASMSLKPKNLNLQGHWSF